MQSGTYRPKLDVKVTAWPLPDANGDGDPVLDDNGGEVHDKGGNVVKEYAMPDGFTDLHDNGTGVKVNAKGQPVRDVDGEAVTIVPGGAVVEYPDGTVKGLDADEANAFSRAYSLHSDNSPAPTPDPAPAPTADPTTADPAADGGSGN